MKKISIILYYILLITFASAQTKTVPVFVSGTEGHKSDRIP
ncbi:MAG: hypothetical protein ABIQ00_10465 [Chitinophagaceae bacterium]